MLLGATRAEAQVSAGVTVETDYRARGVSWTSGKPDAQLHLSYDHPSGLYASGAVILGENADGHVDAIGHVESVGFAKRTGSDLTLDVGALYWHLSAPTTYTLPPSTRYPYGYSYTQTYRAEYAELYAGGTKGPVSAHLYYSPDYIGDVTNTVYADVSVARQLGSARVFAHAGLLHTLDGALTSRGERSRVDYRVGAAYGARFGELQLYWTGADGAEYPVGTRRASSGLVLSATAFF
jgi:hypothetical protein